LVNASPGARALGILALSLLVLVLPTGCKKSQVDRGLESDANGYQCSRCAAKFYTGRETFANRCPECKRPEIEQVLGFTCPADQHVTVAPRSRGARKCEKCGGATAGMVIPGEKELKTWGATRREAAEVGA
jgi:hypothetical protein